jgi:hypothetical protein
LLKVFIKGTELYGIEGFIKVLRNAEKKMGKIIMKKKVWKKVVRQLSHKLLLNVEYDKDYNAVLIRLLN